MLKKKVIDKKMEVGKNKKKNIKKVRDKKNVK